MQTRFDTHLLRRLRNDIPIADFIANVLELPHKHSEGHFRFLCPICNEFRTATNKKTNLARCFLCARNFNCIDLMITVHRMDFKNAANFLTRVLNAYDNHPKP